MFEIVILFGVSNILVRNLKRNNIVIVGFDKLLNSFGVLEGCVYVWGCLYFEEIGEDFRVLFLWLNIRFCIYIEKIWKDLVESKSWGSFIICFNFESYFYRFICKGGSFIVLRCLSKIFE